MKRYSESTDWDEYANKISYSMFLVEKKMGVMIDEDYPLTKFFVQMEYLGKYYKDKEKAQKKADRRKGRR